MPRSARWVNEADCGMPTACSCQPLSTTTRNEAWVSQAAEEVARTYTSRGARALYPDLFVNGTSAWAIRDEKHIVGALPLPSAVTDATQAQECALLAESIAATDATADRSVTLLTSLIGAVAVAAVLNLAQDPFGVPSSVLDALYFPAFVILAVLLVAYVQRTNPSPEVWARRSAAYFRRVREIEDTSMLRLTPVHWEAVTVHDGGTTADCAGSSDARYPLPE